MVSLGAANEDLNHNKSEPYTPGSLRVNTLYGNMRAATSGVNSKKHGLKISSSVLQPKQQEISSPGTVYRSILFAGGGAHANAGDNALVSVDTTHNSTLKQL